MSTEKPDPADEIRTRALERARAIVAAFASAEPIEGMHTAPLALGAAFHAAGDGLHEEADATVERRKKGWQSLSKEFRTVAAQLVGIAQDLAELAKLDRVEPPELATRSAVQFGQGYVYTEPSTGEQHVLDPADVTVILRDPNADHDHAHDAQVTADAAAGTVRRNGTGEIVTPTLPAVIQPGDILSIAVSGEFESRIVLDEDRTFTREELAAEIAQARFFADRPAEPYTAATDPVTSQDDVRAYLAGDTDTIPAGLTAGTTIEINGEDVTHQVVSDTLPPVVAAIDEAIKAGTSEPWAPGERKSMITIDGEDVTRQVINHNPFTTTEDRPMHLAFEDPAPIAAQFQREPFPGASKQRVTFEHLMTPVHGTIEHLPEHWSWSQLTTSEDCGVAYRLGRLEGVRQQPQWANVGGTAFHAVTEAFDRGAYAAGGADLLPEPVADLLRQRWEGAFAASIAATAEVFGIEMGEEGANWRASKQGKENYTWWLVEGEKMLAQYVKLRRQLDAAARKAGTLALPLMVDHTDEATKTYGVAPVIELEYERPVPGPTGVLMVKGVIDRAYRCVDGSIMIKDLKSGSGKGDSGQLGEYAWALVHLLFNQYPRPGADIDLRIRGCFYDARGGIFSEPIELLGKPNHPHAEYVYRYHTAEMHRRAGLYSPHKSPFCNGCSVRHACPIGGTQ